MAMPPAPTASFGKIDEFDPTTDSWDIYCERLHHCFTARNIDENATELKRAILLSEMGKTAYTLLRNLCAPVKPGDKTFAELIKLMHRHQHPQPSIIVERLKFHKRDRQPSESVAAYVSELRRLSVTCDFENNLDSSLRDRLVCGINDDGIQRRLLAEKTLDFNKAFALAQSMELAARNVQDMKQQSHVNTPKMSAASPLGHINKLTTHKVGQTVKPCDRCGGLNHTSPQCRFKDVTCRNCGKVGHIERVCRSAPTQAQRGRGFPNRGRSSHPGYRRVDRGRGFRGRNSTNQVVFDAPAPDDTDYDIYKVDVKPSINVQRGVRQPPILANVLLNGQPLALEVDTGAATSLINEETYRNLWENPPVLQPAHECLRSYLGEKIPLLGSTRVNIKYGDQSADVQVLVVQGKRANLFGRDWLKEIRLDWGSIMKVGSTELEDTLNKYSDVFREELGELKDMQVKIDITVPAQPRFYKHRNIAYALRERVESELERLEKQGVIEPVKYSEWAAPIVPVLKSDQSSVRICGDYKMTINQVAKPDCYPIPRIDDLFASLSNGERFTKLDMSNAYQQLVLDKESRELTTINTHKGLYQYRRLPFGVSAALAIFQRTMECMLRGIPHVCVYLDDILITGGDDAEHNDNLSEVLDRLDKGGLRLNAGKCHFKQKSVSYLGFRIDADGLHPLEDKVQALVAAPAPQNVTELKSFLGLVQYYQKFLPYLANTLAPLHGLLKKHVHWAWTSKKDDAFQRVKCHLASCKLLAHYDPKLPINLACDASPYGVGAVLSHVMPDGSEKPVAYASRSLASAEKNYSQLDKEALAIIFGVKRFHQYIYGRTFQLVSDHKPLMSILDAQRGIPVMASARLQRWALMLAAYDYSIVYRPGSKLANADCLSRLPIPQSVPTPPVPGDTIMLLEKMDEFPVIVSQIRTWTNKDPLLSRVRKLVQCGFPEHLKSDNDLKPYLQRRFELSVQDQVLLWGQRVVVPPQGRTRVLDELHNAHPGIARMKALARSLVWWPGIDAALEDKVQTCSICQESRAAPAEANLHPWDWPEKPWSRLHLDYAGPLQGKMFLVLIDAHSKWMDVFPVHSATTSATLECLRRTFAIHGIPETIVTDNGSCFTSEEFATCMLNNGIQHICVAPYHPASNGMAERAVQTFKQGFTKMREGTIETSVSRFLFRYRNTPQSTTRISPAEMLLGRRPRSHLDLMHPDIGRRVHQQQQKQVEKHNMHAKDRTLRVGETVFVMNFDGKSKWLCGVIVEQTGPVSFRIRLDDGRVVRRHVDYVRSRRVSEREEMSVPEKEQSTEPFLELPPELTAEEPVQIDPPDVLEHEREPPAAVVRRSDRIRKAPEKLNL